LGAFMAFILFPILGGYSDKFGRRPFILICVGLESIPYICLGFYPYLPLQFYLAARAFAKLTSFAIISGYVADVTSIEDRSKAFGLVMASVFAGIIIGPLIPLAGMQLSFKIAGLLMIGCWLYILIFVPESRPASASDIISDSVVAVPRAKQNHFRQMLYIFRYSQVTKSIFLMTCFSQLSEQGVAECVLLYLKVRFDVSSTFYSFWITALGVESFVVLFFIFPCWLRRTNEKTILMIALVFNWIHVLLYALIWLSWQAFVCSIFGAMGMMEYAASQGIISKQVPPSEQGLASGGFAGLKTLGQGFGPLLFNGLLSFFTSSKSPIDFPQAPFIVAFFLIGIAFLILLKLPPIENKREIITEKLLQIQAETPEVEKPEYSVVSQTEGTESGNK